MTYTNLSGNHDLRRHHRYRVDAGVLQVSWLDTTGTMKMARTRALNVSEEGICVELPKAAMPLMVRFQSERFNVNGLGAVRYCRCSGGKYVVGLEFTEGLHWRAPQEAVPEPMPLCDPAPRS